MWCQRTLVSATWTHYCDRSCMRLAPDCAKLLSNVGFGHALVWVFHQQAHWRILRERGVKASTLVPSRDRRTPVLAGSRQQSRAPAIRTCPSSAPQACMTTSRESSPGICAYFSPETHNGFLLRHSPARKNSFPISTLVIAPVGASLTRSHVTRCTPALALSTRPLHRHTPHSPLHSWVAGRETQLVGQLAVDFTTEPSTGSLSFACAFRGVPRRPTVARTRHRLPRKRCAFVLLPSKQLVATEIWCQHACQCPKLRPRLCLCRKMGALPPKSQW
jgi:hypothetical protein